MGRWNDPRNDRWRAPDDQKYLGMSATRFNLTVVGIGLIALAAFLYFGGVGVVRDFVGDDSPSSRQVEVVQTGTSTATAAAPTPTRAPTTPATEADAGGSGSSVAALLDTFNPSMLLGAIGGAAPPGASTPSQEADGSLEAALLDEGDLPPGFLLFGEFSFYIPTESGTGEMAANMFASGDLASGDFGPMVMSAVVEAPSDAAGELGDLSGLDEISQVELDELAAAFEQSGIGFSDFRLLDASGLGDGGIGMHLVMDFSGLFETFGALDEEPPPFDAIAWDMYIFVRGERMLMLMVMWPDGGSPGVDGRALAETMDAKAAAS